jgi:hypothetical protein
VGTVTVVRDDIHTSCVTRSGHGIPAHARQMVARPVQPDITSDLCVLLHLLAFLLHNH